MFKAAAIAAAVLFGAATLACAQGASLGTHASSASRTAAPANAAASGFAIEEKGVKQTDNSSVGKAGTVTLDGGAAPQMGRVQGGQALGPATTQRGSGSNLKSHTNSGDSDRAERARLVSGDYGNDASVTDRAGSALRGKPTKDQRTFNESRSNNTRTTGPIVNNGTGRTPGAAITPSSPVGDTSGNKSFFESRSNTARTPGGTATADDAAAQVTGKIKSNPGMGNGLAKPALPEAPPAFTTGAFK
ncbi:MAG: hypothetical protein ABI724_06290 [Betaproteobacteria bacterium]